MSSFNFVGIESPEEFRMRISNKMTVKIDICLPGSRHNGGERQNCCRNWNKYGVISV